MKPEDTPIEVLEDRLKIMNMLRVCAMKENFHESVLAYGNTCARLINEIESKRT